MKSLRVNLTRDQSHQLSDARDELYDMSAIGEPGMLVAQVYRDCMVVQVFDHKKAVLVQRALGHYDEKITDGPDDRRVRAMEQTEIEKGV